MRGLPAPRTTRLGALAVSLVVALSVLQPVASSAREVGSDVAHIARQRPEFVTVVVRVADCPSCRLHMESVIDWPFDLWHTRWKHIRDGQVTFKVPAKRTRGSIFMIDAPWVDWNWSRALVAMRYARFDQGDPVSAEQAARSKKGSACWVGIGHGSITITVGTGRFKGWSAQRERVTGIRAWSLTSRKKLAQYRLTHRGMVGTQEPVPCGKPTS